MLVVGDDLVVVVDVMLVNVVSDGCVAGCGNMIFGLSGLLIGAA